MTARHAFPRLPWVIIAAVLLLAGCADEPEIQLDRDSPVSSTRLSLRCPTTLSPGEVATFYASELDSTEGTWDFGDGTTATGREAAHIFSSTGSYLIEFTTGEVSETCYVNVVGIAPPDMSIDPDPRSPSDHDSGVGFADPSEGFVRAHFALNSALLEPVATEALTAKRNRIAAFDGGAGWRVVAYASPDENAPYQRTVSRVRRMRDFLVDHLGVPGDAVITNAYGVHPSCPEALADLCRVVFLVPLSQTELDEEQAFLDRRYAPWPPSTPVASGELDLTRLLNRDQNLLFSSETVGEVESSLLQALESSGYTDIALYSLPSQGFALVPHVEQIEWDGTPKPGADRFLWGRRAPTPGGRWDRIRQAFSAQSGYWRRLVFFITPAAINHSGTPVSEGELDPEQQTGGAASLPGSISSAQARQMNVPIYRGYVYLYEMYKPHVWDDEVRFLIEPPIGLRTHLAKAGLGDLPLKR